MNTYLLVFALFSICGSGGDSAAGANLPSEIQSGWATWILVAITDSIPWGLEVQGYNNKHAFCLCPTEGHSAWRTC